MEVAPGMTLPRKLIPLLLVHVVASLVGAGVTAAPASATTGETSLCYRSDYGCVSSSGYSGQPVWGSDGPGHNCVSYAAYRLQQNGVGVRPWDGAIGNGADWDENARGAGYRVDTSPSVGSIAQWDGGFGHVAYVEVVTSTYIEITEDAYLSDTSGYSSRRRLDRSGSTYGAAEFIHVRDIVTPSTSTTTEPKMLVVRQGSSTLIGKSGLTDGWANLGGFNGRIVVAGERLAVLTPAGDLYAKDGLHGSWIKEAGAVTEFAVSSKMLVVRQGSSTLIGKSGLTDGWANLGGFNGRIVVAGERLAVLTPAGDLYAKDGLHGTWINEAGAVTDFAVSG